MTCGLPIRRVNDTWWIHDSAKWDPFKHPHAARPLDLPNKQARIQP